MRYAACSLSLFLATTFASPAFSFDTNQLAANERIIGRTWAFESVHVYGGDFFSGYYRQTVDFKNRKMEGRWDRKYPKLETAERSRSLNNVVQNGISLLIRGFKRMPNIPEERCGQIADGIEASVVVNFKTQAGTARTLKIVPEESFNFVCGDQYVTQESFLGLIKYLEAILPPPEGFAPNHS